MDFYARFEELCAMKGVTPRSAAIEMGLSHSLPSKWKREKSTPTSATLLRIANYFRVPIETLDVSDDTVLKTAMELIDMSMDTTYTSITDEEWSFIVLLRRADDIDKATIKSILSRYEQKKEEARSLA